MDFESFISSRRESLGKALKDQVCFCVMTNFSMLFMPKHVIPLLKQSQ